MESRLETVEDAVYAYLQTIVPLASWYLAEFPRAAISTDPRMIMFAMEGGQSAINVTLDEQVYAWSMTAFVRGIYGDRDTSLTDLWAIMDATPLGPEEIASVQRIDVQTPPTITRQVIELENDLTSGGESRVWAFELPLLITFERS